jgi:transposase
MEHFVGIDVAQDRLSVHVRPAGEDFAVARDGTALAALVEQLAALAPALIVIEATGGYETVVASAIAAAQLRRPRKRPSRRTQVAAPARPAGYAKVRRKPGPTVQQAQRRKGGSRLSPGLRLWVSTSRPSCLRG